MRKLFIRLPDLSGDGSGNPGGPGSALLSGHFSDLLPADKEIYHLLSNCLLCGACAENCASGVKADELIQKGRSLFLEKVGPGKWKKFWPGKFCPMGIA